MRLPSCELTAAPTSYRGFVQFSSTPVFSVWTPLQFQYIRTYYYVAVGKKKTPPVLTIWFLRLSFLASVPLHQFLCLSLARLSFVYSVSLPPFSLASVSLVISFNSIHDSFTPSSTTERKRENAA